MWALAQRPQQPAALLLAEIHLQPGEALPRLPGYSRVFVAARPDGYGGVAILLADSWKVAAALWRSDAADGRLWVRVQGALPGGLPLFLGTAYLPPQGSPGCPEDVPAWFLRHADVLAEAEAAGAALHAMDANGRTASLPDWPDGDEDAGCPARRSSDTAAPNSHGRQLLSLCQSSAARICNGRVPGTTSGDATSFGSRGTGRAVVDYWLASASLLPRLPTMAVDSWGLAAQHSDHATLLLELAAPPAVQRDSTAQQEHTSAPPQQRQFELGTAEQLAAAVALLAGTQRQLDALAAAAESAASPAALEQLAAAFAELMVETLDGAGMRQRSSNGGAQRPHSLPRSLQRQYGIRDARRAQRNAVQQAAVAQQRGIGPEQQDAALRREVGRCRNRLKRRLVAAWHKCQALRGEKLEQLDKTDPQAFFFRLKPQAAKQLNLVPEDVARHFQHLLGTAAQPPAHRPPPEPPPEPPPATSPVSPTTAASTAAPQPALPPAAPPPATSPAPALPAHASATTHPSPAPPATSPTTAASTAATQPDITTLAARLGSPITPAEVAAFASQAKPRKAVAGELPPWFLKAAAEQLAPVLAAVYTAWRRVGQLATPDALSIIAPILKPGGDPTSCSSLRGIAIGTMAAKLYAAILEQRISDWAEASNFRAAGQFGFRRQRGTAQAALVLRALQDQHRLRGQQLWGCFVDFKQAYDRVPREQLWQKLAARGVDTAWLAAAQALYSNVPMSVRTSAGLSPCFQAVTGLKQGCPLSPTLFGLYIDDLEEELMAAARRGEQLDLPSFLGSGGAAVPPLLYADDMVLLATSAAGLQRQLNLLQQYCRQWGLTVNIDKTKLMLLSGRRTQHAAQQTAEAAGLTFAGQQLAAVTSFKYLGIAFHSSTCLAGAAAPARAQLARLAMHNCRTRCAEVGIEAAPVQLRLFGTMVDSVLSHGAEVWGVQLAAKAACCHRGSAGSAAEKLQLSYLRHLLGVRQSTPNAALLAETGERPLWQRWLRRAAKLWNKTLEERPGSLLQQALLSSVQLADGAHPLAQQSWAAQLAAGLAAVGMQLDLQQPATVDLGELGEAAQRRQLAQLQEALAKGGASRLEHYVHNVVGALNLAPAMFGQRETYLDAVRRRQDREALAQLRTGSHWGAEESGRWTRRPREQRVCPHCHDGIEDAPHMLLTRPLYAPLRLNFPDLFAEPHPPHRFLRQKPCRLAAFAAACHQRWLTATVALPAVPP